MAETANGVGMERYAEQTTVLALLRSGSYWRSLRRPTPSGSCGAGGGGREPGRARDRRGQTLGVIAPF